MVEGGAASLLTFRGLRHRALPTGLVTMAKRWYQGPSFSLGKGNLRTLSLKGVTFLFYFDRRHDRGGKKGSATKASRA